MANVGFRQGPQSNVDTIISNGRGAINGSFYLTNDSHRLYIGAESESMPGEYTLYAVNEGVENVKTLTDLTSRNWDADAKKAAAGRFYYIEDRNVLAIFNGKDFIQINVDTDTSIKNVEFSGEKAQAGESIDIEQVITWGDRNNESMSKLQLVTDNGLTCDTVMLEDKDGQGKVIRRYPKITISGDSYSFSQVTIPEGKNEFTLALQSENGVDTGDPLKFKGAGGIHFSMDADGNIIVASDDTQILEDSLKVENTATGLKISLTDSKGINTSTAFWSPFIMYGQATDEAGRSKAQFSQGTAKLDIYTAAEIDQLLKDLNGMTYKGTAGDTGSYADNIIFNGTVGQVVRNGEQLTCRIGDMIVLAEEKTINNRKYAPGTIVICRSSTGAENLNGEIDPNNLVFDIIDAIENTDTTYTLQSLTSAHGVQLIDKNAINAGYLVFEQGKAKKTLTDTNGNTTTVDVTGLNVHVDSQNTEGKTTIIIYHEAIARTDETGTKAQSAESFKFTAIESVETDDTGHVSKVVTKEVTVYDTANDVSGNAFKTDVYTQNGKNVGVVKSTITSTNKYTSATDTKADAFVLVSESLAIANDDTNPDQAGGTSNKQGLSIEMVWGTF